MEDENSRLRFFFSKLRISGCVSGCLERVCGSLDECEEIEDLESIRGVRRDTADSLDKISNV